MLLARAPCRRARPLAHSPSGPSRRDDNEYLAVPKKRRRLGNEPAVCIARQRIVGPRPVPAAAFETRRVGAGYPLEPVECPPLGRHCGEHPRPRSDGGRPAELVEEGVP